MKWVSMSDKPSVMLITIFFCVGYLIALSCNALNSIFINPLVWFISVSIFSKPLVMSLAVVKVLSKKRTVYGLALYRWSTWMMMLCVNYLVCNFKILYSVIRSYSIFVMNNLIGSKLSTYMILNNLSVKKISIPILFPKLLKVVIPSIFVKVDSHISSLIVRNNYTIGVA
jgi:hypothetical protein